MTKEWKAKYRGNKVNAICLLIIDHYKYVMLIRNNEKMLVNNPQYLLEYYLDEHVKYKRKAWL